MWKNEISLKHISVVNPFVYKQIANILAALQNYSVKKAYQVVKVRPQYIKSIHEFGEEIPASNIKLLLGELQRINERISIIEQKVESINKTIEHQFTSLTPFEKQLSRLEDLYRTIDGLENRILLQEESLKSMVERHLQITLYTQELSRTSKDVYDLMKLVLMNSIITKTNI